MSLVEIEAATRILILPQNVQVSIHYNDLQKEINLSRLSSSMG